MAKLDEDLRAKCVEYALRIFEANPTEYKLEAAAIIAVGLIEAAKKLEEYLKA